ncbi:MAG: DNA-3-methyladenine glycosylase family protein [Cyanophyceae cyanobacterium]
MNDGVAAQFLKQADPILGQLIEGKLANAERPRSDLLPELARAIIAQQISTAAAASIYRRFIQFYADAHAPLTAEMLLATPPEKLRSLGISRPKVNYLLDLAQKVHQGLPTLETLEAMDDEDIIKTLTQVKGVGRWTVQMLLIFRLQRPDVLPVDDLGIRKAVQKLYQLDELPSRKTLEQLGHKWKPYRSTASRYLWQSLKIVNSD